MNTHPLRQTRYVFEPEDTRNSPSPSREVGVETGWFFFFCVPVKGTSPRLLLDLAYAIWNAPELVRNGDLCELAQNVGLQIMPFPGFRDAGNVGNRRTPPFGNRYSEILGVFPALNLPIRARNDEISSISDIWVFLSRKFRVPPEKKCHFCPPDKGCPCSRSRVCKTPRDSGCTREI